MTQELTKFGCNHSLGVICGIFASIAVASFLAEDQCLDRGGRVSDTAWSCETAAGAIESLWALVTPGAVALVIVAIGIPVYFAVVAVGRRWIFAHGNRHG